MRLTIALLLIFAPLSLSAQYYQGTAMGNYAGTNALYHNPAFVADSRYIIHGNLAGLQFMLGNNHIRYAAPFSLVRLGTSTYPNSYLGENGKLSFNVRFLSQRLNGRAKYLNMNGDFKGPALMFALAKNRIGIGLTSRLRAIGNLNRTTEPIARLIRGGLQDTTLARELYKGQSAHAQFNVLGEIGLTLGGVLLDDDNHFLKAGVTLKRMLGVFNANLQLNAADYSLSPDHTFDNRRYKVNISSASGQYGFTSSGAYQNAALSPGWLFGRDMAGRGWGFDLGVVYEFRHKSREYSYTEINKKISDPSKNKYVLRLAASLMDFGAVRFDNPNYVNQRSFENADGILNHENFATINNADALYGAINRSLDLPEPERGDYSVVLPTTFQASADYNFKPRMYVSALWVQGIMPAADNRIIPESVISITPRYELRWLEVSLPVSIMNQYRSFGIGIGARLGPLWFGTDHLTSLFNIGDPMAFNFYAGLSIGIFQSPIKSKLLCWPPKKGWLGRMFSNKE